MEKKPSVQEIQAYLDTHDPLGLRGAIVEPVAERNHLIYRVEKAGQVFCLRTINPESYRRREWITMAEEYAILRAIEPTGLGPRAYHLDEGSSPPFLIQEFVEATCFNDLKPLSGDRLTAAARAIAVLNSCDISPEHFPFMRKYVHRGYRGSARSWWYRLGYAVFRTRRADVIRWAGRIVPLALQSARVLARFEPELPREFTLHFDGAHTGNTYWRDGRVMFLDWQKVSWRNDPSFTLVRFATSLGADGVMPEGAFEFLLHAYLDVRGVPRFAEVARMRLLERQTADLVWVLYDYARRGDRRPVEEGTSVARRYEEVSTLLQRHGG